MIKIIPILLVLALSSCYSIPEIEGFDQDKWSEEVKSCEQSRIQLAELIIGQKEKILGEGQAEVKALLGQPDEHELYQRNQKFFYYDLTARQDTCQFQRLSIRFDALDRVKELMIVE